jgi:hypothetical protein
MIKLRKKSAILVRALIAVGLVISSLPAAAQVSKIEGYDGYLFGMTVEQALRVKAGTNYAPCEFKDVVGCIEYDAMVSAFPTRVAVQFKGASPRLVQVVLKFDSLREPIRHPCKVITAELVRLLVARYGGEPLVVQGDATWTSAQGGSVSLTQLCIDDKRGINAVVYRPSAAL